MFTIDTIDGGFKTLNDAIAAGKSKGVSFSVVHPDTKRPIYRYDPRRDRGTILVD